MVIHSTVGELIKGTKQPLLNEREKNIWSVIIHFNFSNQCCQFCTDNMCVTLCTVSIVHQMKFRYLLLQRVAPPRKNSGEMIMYYDRSIKHHCTITTNWLGIFESLQYELHFKMLYEEKHRMHCSDVITTNTILFIYVFTLSLFVRCFILLLIKQDVRRSWCLCPSLN